jgi:hypothetical protein
MVTNILVLVEQDRQGKAIQIKAIPQTVQNH